MNKITKTVGCVALAAAMGFSLAGCGGYKPKETQGITDKYIYIGNTAATTGNFATVGVPFNYGLEAALEAYNKAGGFGEKGLQVKLKHYDDEFNAEKGVTYTEKLVESDRVFAIVGHFGTNTVGATTDYLRSIGIPTVYAATGISDLYQENAKGKNACIYPVQPIYDAEGQVLLARAIASKDGNYGIAGKKIGVFSTDDDAGQGLLSGIKKQWSRLTAEQKEGKTITYREGSSSATEFSAAVTAFKEAGCDTIIVACNQAPLKTFMTNAARASLDAQYITSYVNASASTLGDIAKSTGISEDKIFSTAWLDIMNHDITNDATWTKYTKETLSEDQIKQLVRVAAYDAYSSGLGEAYTLTTENEGQNVTAIYYKETDSESETATYRLYTPLTAAPALTDYKINGTYAFIANNTYLTANYNNETTGDVINHTYSLYQKEYWTFYNDVDAYCKANGLNTLEYSGNSYAIAGYIAGRTFLQGLERLGAEGKELSWSTYKAALESAPVRVAMGGTVDFANGNRFGVQDLALNKLTKTVSGEKTTYSLATVDVIRPISEVLSHI